MRVSDLGREFIKREEGVRLRMYRDSAGFPTIGVGHKIKPTDQLGVVITAEEADRLLAEDLAVSERAVLRLVEPELQQHEFDALCSFCFNVGQGNLQRSTLLKRINSGDFEDVPRQMARWVYAGDQDGDGDVDINDRVAGLMARREREGRLFATGEYGLSL